MLVSSAELQRWIAEEIQKELLDEISYDLDDLKARRAREYAEKERDKRAPLKVPAYVSQKERAQMAKVPFTSKDAKALWAKQEFDKALATEIKSGGLDHIAKQYAALHKYNKLGVPLDGRETSQLITRAFQNYYKFAPEAARGRDGIGEKRWGSLASKNFSARMNKLYPEINRREPNASTKPERAGKMYSEFMKDPPSESPKEKPETAPAEPEAPAAEPGAPGAEETSRRPGSERWSGMGGYPPEAPPAAPAAEPEAAAAEPEAAAAEPEEAASAAIKVAKNLGRSRSVKEFFNTFLEAVTDSFDGNHKQQAAALKRLHSSRRILQDLSGEDKLAPDGEIDFNNAEVKELLDRYVYDFGLPSEAAQAYKKHFVTLVHNAEQRRRGEEEDKAYLANTGGEKEEAPSPEAAPSAETPATPAAAAPDKSEKPKMSRRERRRLAKLRHGAGAFEPLTGIPGGRGSVPAQAIMDLDLEDAEDEEAIAGYLRDKGYEITEANIKECQALLKEYRELKRWKELARIK